MKELSILELAEKGGWIMLVLAILSIVAIYIFTERFIVIHNARQTSCSWIASVTM